MPKIVQDQYENLAQKVSDEGLTIHQRQNPTESKYLFLMVHGLGGTHYGANPTFGQFPRYLYDDFRDADIGSYSYKTLFRRKILRSVDMPDEARILAHEIRDSSPYVGVILIAHSMGGLLCKASIAFLIKSGQSKVLDRVLGIFLLATPQLGSKRGLPFLSCISSDLSALKIHGEFIAETNEVFAGHVCVDISLRQSGKTLIPVWAVGALPDFWVDKVSATASIPPGQIRFVKGSHTSIVKPKSKDHAAYMFVRERVQDCVLKMSNSVRDFPIQASRNRAEVDDAGSKFIGENDALEEAKKKFDQSDLKEAYRAFDEAFRQSKGKKSAEGEAMALLGMARVERVRGRHEQSRAKLSEARVRCWEISDSRGEAEALLGVGDLDRLLGRLAEAGIAYIEAKSLFERSDDRTGKAKALRGLGEIRRMQSQYPEAIQCYQEALDLFKVVSDTLGEASILVNLGDLERQRGEISKARKYYYQAEGLYEREGYRLGQANVLVGLGDLDLENEDVNEARTKFFRAKVLYEQGSARRGEADVLLHLGDLERKYGSLPAAGNSYADALEIYEEVGDRLCQAHALLGRANVLRDVKDSDQVRELLRKARRLYRDVLDFRGEADVLKALGDIERKAEDLELAKQHFYQAALLYELAGVEGEADEVLEVARGM